MRVSGAKDYPALQITWTITRKHILSAPQNTKHQVPFDSESLLETYQEKEKSSTHELVYERSERHS